MTLKCRKKVNPTNADTLSSVVMYLEACKNCRNSHAVCDLEEDACLSLSSRAYNFSVPGKPCRPIRFVCVCILCLNFCNTSKVCPGLGSAFLLHSSYPVLSRRVLAPLAANDFCIPYLKHGSNKITSLYLLRKYLEKIFDFLCPWLV